MNDTQQQVVTGGNVADPEIGTCSWRWMDAHGKMAREYHYWFTTAKKQGVIVTQGSYQFRFFFSRLRCLNIRFTGPAEAIKSLKDVIAKYGS